MQHTNHTQHALTTDRHADEHNKDAMGEHNVMPHSGMNHSRMQHNGMQHGAMSMASPVTRPQLLAVTFLTILALTTALLFSAARTNLTLSAADVGGAIMPPGMIMSRDLPGAAMRDMAAVDLREVTYRAPVDARGDTLLQPQLVDGIKVFMLETAVIEWPILPGVEVAAYAFNRQVPGPRIQVMEGDRLRINVTNHLPDPTSVHWHGVILPNAMDGAADITQAPIPPGGQYTYEFVAQQPGTFFYHSHTHVDRQQPLGLYGALIVEPRNAPATPAYNHEVVLQLQEWTFKEGYTFPAMPMEGALPNYFTINGKAYPATERVNMRVGERLLVRFIGSHSGFVHPMHIHGGPFRILEADGYPVPAGAQIEKDTINVSPGERYDVLWEARKPGKWLIHCHINHHTTNNNVEEEGGGGLMMIIDVQ